MIQKSLIFLFDFQFSSIYFRDVTFTELPNDFKFEDRYEVVFERVKISPDINYATKIVVENENSTINPVFRLEESEFPGVEDVTSSDINENKFILEVTNAQFAYDGDEKLCNYDYKGDITIRRNNFGHLRDKNFFIRGAQAFKFENNAIGLVCHQLLVAMKLPLGGAVYCIWLFLSILVHFIFISFSCPFYLIWSFLA